MSPWGLVGLLGLLWAAPAGAAEDWSRVTSPAPGKAEVFGSAAAGCFRGGQPLSLDDPHYQVLRPSRNRYWGHPSLVRFVLDLSAAAVEQGIPGLLIGDMGQPRGGPMPSGHASHQNGLDIDIWFRLENVRLAQAEIEAPGPRGMVRDKAVDPAVWRPDQARLLELAARSPEVERIFVNPAIKQALCRSAAPGDRDWLAKLRPWWGHDEHFHVRLACPADSPLCEVQKPFPPGDGCGGELDSWLTKPTVPAPPSRPHVQTRVLPEPCAGVLRGKSG